MKTKLLKIVRKRYSINREVIKKQIKYVWVDRELGWNVRVHFDTFEEAYKFLVRSIRKDYKDTRKTTYNQIWYTQEKTSCWKKLLKIKKWR